MLLPIILHHLNTNQILFKYKSDLIKNGAADGTVKNVTIAVPLKYLRDFWISLEIPLIN